MVPFLAVSFETDHCPFSGTPARRGGWLIILRKSQKRDLFVEIVFRSECFHTDEKNWKRLASIPISTLVCCVSLVSGVSWVSGKVTDGRKVINGVSGVCPEKGYCFDGVFCRYTPEGGRVL